MELGVDAFQVTADRLETYPHRIGHLLVEIAARHIAEDLLLTRGESVFGIAFRPAAALKGLNHLSGDVTGHRGAAAPDFVDGLEDFLRGAALRDIACCSNV